MADLDKKSSQYHDKLFQFVFSHLQQVVDFLQGTLPSEIINDLDLSSLVRVYDSFVDPKLKKTFSDIVYRCRFREVKVKIVFLLEHKSQVPDYPHLQLLRYMLNLWDQQVRDREELNPVIPIIVYHGRERWEAKTLADYFPNVSDSLFRFLPSFDYLLTDLSKEEKAVLLSRYRDEILQRTLLLLKYIYDRYLVDHMEDILQGLAETSDQQTYDFFRIFIVYINDRRKKDSEVMEKLEDIIDNWPIPEGTPLYRWLAKAEARGRERAESKLKDEIARVKEEEALVKKLEYRQNIIRMLSADLSVEQISLYLNISKMEVEKIAREEGLM